MELFDNISRDYIGPAKYAEPRFGYYNRSARQDIDKIRQLIETWFTHYPAKHQKELYAKFRSSIAYSGNLDHSFRLSVTTQSA